MCSSFPTQLALAGIFTLAGLAAVDGNGLLSMPFVVVISLADTVVLVGLMVGFLWAHGQSARGLWLGHRSVGREAVHGLLLTPAVFLLVVVVLAALQRFAPWLHNVPANPLEQFARQGPGAAAALAVVAIVAGGLREELQRAFLLDRFERHLGGRAAGVVVVSVAFGLGHFVQGWDAVIATGALGAFWAIVYLRRRSAVAPVVSHAAFNSLEILRVVAGGVAGGVAGSAVGP